MVVYLQHTGCPLPPVCTIPSRIGFIFLVYSHFFLYLCTEMEKSDKIINIILTLVALGLLALCIASVAG